MLKSYKISQVCSNLHEIEWEGLKKHVSSVITILQRVFFLAVDKLI